MGSHADKVIGMMEKIKLTESEKRCLKFGGSGGGAHARKEPQAVGRVLTEKPVRADALEAALGRIWCPLKGIKCKDLGDNRFLFTFLQGSGKWKAMEDGPWMFGKDLIILAKFDGAKRIDEINFTSIPIWVRVSKLPLGLMNKAAGEEIGDMIGDVLRVDADDDDMAFGECLRIKIRLDIRRPLMRGVMLDVGDGGEERKLWCPLSYEFLPDFCYTRGLIGHTDRFCDIQLKKGEAQQFSRAMRFIPEKRRVGEDVSNRSSGQNSQLPWKVNRGGRGADGGFGSWGSGSGKGSDAPSWKKPVSDNKSQLGREAESEASSPLKLKSGLAPSEHVKKLNFGDDKVPSVTPSVFGTN